MQTENNLYQLGRKSLQERHNCLNSRVAKANGALRIFIIILFITMFFLENSDIGWTAQTDSNDTSQEYKSTDIPKTVSYNKILTSELIISEMDIITGIDTIVDIDVKLAIMNTGNPYNYICSDIYLISPDGTRIELALRLRSNAYDSFYVFDDGASLSITEDTLVCSGTYRPKGHLSDLYNKKASGIWKLELTNYSPTPTTLTYWSLTINKTSIQPVIQSKQSIAGGICDTVFWNDIGLTNTYKVNKSQTIPDNGTLQSEQVINDYCMIEDVNVMVDINHNIDSELGVFLISPDNTRVELFTDVGGSSANFNNTILDDEASVSITAGSAPFRGVFKPEGELSNLIGKNIFGTWNLEVSDDTQGTTGTLKSWLLNADLADIVYYAECSANSDFDAILTNSGWTIDRAFTFNDLDPNQQYWYRVKARPLKTWYQTTTDDFEAGTLTNTIATEGEVKISPGASTQLQKINVIQNPSFESVGGWVTQSNDSSILVGSVSKETWATDGDLSAVIAFQVHNGFYYYGNYASFKQSVDWTNIDTLVFDYCCLAFPELTAKVYIGDVVVWERNSTGTSWEEHLDQTIDVSRFNGVKDLRISSEYNIYMLVSFSSYCLWDNLRTYKKVEVYPPYSGNIISGLITINEADTWDLAAFHATIPEGTNLTIDVLSENGTTPIAGYANIPCNADLSGLKERTIRLRANLSTNDISISPVLHDWVVIYTSSSGETEWSNVVTSSCSQ